MLFCHLTGILKENNGTYQHSGRGWIPHCPLAELLHAVTTLHCFMGCKIGLPGLGHITLGIVQCVTCATVHANPVVGQITTN